MNVEVSAGLESRFAEMKRFVRLGVEDEASLQAFAPRAEPHLRAIAEHFYERIREHEAAFAIFRSEEQLSNMPNILEGWLHRMLNGPYDETYASKSEAIGHVHVKVGLPQRFMFTAMSLFREDLRDLVRRLCPEDPDPIERAIDRILDIELALMNGAYRRAVTEQAQRVERETQAQVLERLELKARRYVRAVDVAGAITVGLTRDRRFCIFNREAERVTGFSSAEAERLRFDDLFFDAHDGASITAQLDRLVDHHEPVLVDVQAGLRTKNGRLRRFQGRLSHHPAIDAEECIIVLTGLDVTDARALRRRVAQTERLAAVGNLAAGLAHEVRNPLNGAQLHLTFARRTVDEEAQPELAEALEVIEGELHRLGALVNEFLDFARPGPLERAPTSVNDLCQTALDRVLEKAGGVRVSSQLLDRDFDLTIDRSKLEQALGNLLDNALEAADRDGGSVGFRVFREPWHVVMEVIDDGPGLPDDAPVFDPFFSTKPKGTGMGLAIAHRIVRDHDGVLEVQRRSGETVFQLRLPLTQFESEMPDVQP